MSRTALVTGGNKGIGYEVCRQLGARGVQVFLAARNESAGTAAAKKLQAEGHKVQFIALDVSSESSILAAAAELRRHTGQLHALVNNAGIFLERDAQGLEFDAANILATFQTNTLGPLLMARAFAPLMTAASGAQLVNVSSGMGQLHDMREGSIAYRISKTALNAVTRILSCELSDSAISVNSVCPGWVKTDMGGPGAHRTLQHGADTIVWLAMGESRATGKFFRDRAEIPW
ncbi:MAG: SDR family oxidoreductase [Proteobacteria bacterium]|nr:SDR family oxidoreductase [Pseudomonadota bacterium]